MCRCGEALETSAHVLHECSCEANSLAREQMTHKIHNSIRTLVAARAITPDWSWFLTRMFSLDNNGKTEMWAQGTTPAWCLWSQGQRIPMKTKDDIMAWIRMGSECLWKASSLRISPQPYMRWACPRKLQISGAAISVNYY